MNVVEVKQDERLELQYVFVLVDGEIPSDTIVEANGTVFNSYVFPPQDPVAPYNCIGFSYLGTDWVFGNDFTLSNSQGSQVVSNYVTEA